MPNLANALGRLGLTVNCIGALGYPQTHAILKPFLRTASLSRLRGSRNGHGV
jgi:hypothetical protein